MGSQGVKESTTINNERFLTEVPNVDKVNNKNFNLYISSEGFREPKKIHKTYLKRYVGGKGFYM